MPVSATVDCYVFFLFSSHIFELKISHIPCLCAPHSIRTYPALCRPSIMGRICCFPLGGEGRMLGEVIGRLVLVRGLEMNKSVVEDMGASNS